MPALSGDAKVVEHVSIRVPDLGAVSVLTVQQGDTETRYYAFETVPLFSAAADIVPTRLLESGEVVRIRSSEAMIKGLGRTYRVMLGIQLVRALPPMFAPIIPDNPALSPLPL